MPSNELLHQKLGKTFDVRETEAYPELTDMPTF